MCIYKTSLIINNLDNNQQSFDKTIWIIKLLAIYFGIGFQNYYTIHALLCNIYSKFYWFIIINPKIKKKKPS